MDADEDHAAVALQYMLDYGGMPPDTQPESVRDAEANRQLLQKRRASNASFTSAGWYPKTRPART